MLYYIYVTSLQEAIKAFTWRLIMITGGLHHVILHLRDQFTGGY